MRGKLLEAILKTTPENGTCAGKTVLVSGASSQIGLNVIALALAGGAQVIALCHRTAIDYVHPRLTLLPADLTAPGPLAVPPAGILIHTAPIWLLPQQLPSFVGAGIKRIVVFSSTSIFGKRDSKDASERSLVETLTGAEDRMSRLAADNDLRLTIFRPTMTYGMGLDINITRMARTIRRLHFVPIFAPAKGLRQPVHARDLAEAGLAISDNPATYGKAYNLGGGETMSYRMIVERLFLRLGEKPRLLALPFLPQSLDLLNRFLPFLHVNGEIARRMNRDQVFDNGPAARDFGYRPRGFLVGDVIL
jgi:nucleoside-diphosphate-sugar epimerase